MFIAVNRFTVKPEMRAAFEQEWTSRETFWAGVPGFVSFQVMKMDGDQPIYLSQTTWASKEAFQGWIGSEAFRRAHAGAHGLSHFYAAPTELSTYEVIRVEDAA